jgi:hypothetical protein
LAPEVASRYLELIGGTETERSGCAAALAAAITALSAGGGGEAIEVTFQPGVGQVLVTIRRAGETRIVECAVLGTSA